MSSEEETQSTLLNRCFIKRSSRKAIKKTCKSRQTIGGFKHTDLDDSLHIITTTSDTELNAEREDDTKYKTEGHEESYLLCNKSTFGDCSKELSVLEELNTTAVKPTMILSAIENNQAYQRASVKKIRTEEKMSMTDDDDNYSNVLKCLNDLNLVDNYKENEYENIQRPQPKRNSYNNKICKITKRRFKNIKSPVSMYINEVPACALYELVKPGRPTSLMEKTSNPPKQQIKTKAFKQLPNIIYKPALNKLVTEVPNPKKLPKSPWAQNLASNLPPAYVIKHVRRELEGNARRYENIQDSRLSIHQADLSLCVKKSAR